MLDVEKKNSNDSICNTGNKFIVSNSNSATKPKTSEINYSYANLKSELEMSISETNTSLTKQINILKNEINFLDSKTHAKILDLNSNISDLKNRIIEVNSFLNSHINTIRSYKIIETLQSNTIKTTLIEKDLKDLQYKYDKVYIDNFSIPGLVGVRGCKFATLKELFKNNYEEIIKANLSLDKIKNDIQTIKNNDNLMNQKINIVSIQNQNYANNRIKLSEENAVVNLNEYKKEMEEKEKINNDLYNELKQKSEKFALFLNEFTSKLNNDIPEKINQEHKLIESQILSIQKIKDFTENYKKNYQNIFKTIETHKRLIDRCLKHIHRCKFRENYDKTFSEVAGNKKVNNNNPNDNNDNIDNNDNNDNNINNNDNNINNNDNNINNNDNNINNNKDNNNNNNKDNNNFKNKINNGDNNDNNNGNNSINNNNHINSNDNHINSNDNHINSNINDNNINNNNVNINNVNRNINHIINNNKNNININNIKNNDNNNDCNNDFNNDYNDNNNDNNSDNKSIQSFNYIHSFNNDIRELPQILQIEENNRYKTEENDLRSNNHNFNKNKKKAEHEKLDHVKRIGDIFDKSKKYHNSFERKNNNNENGKKDVDLKKSEGFFDIKKVRKLQIKDKKTNYFEDNNDIQKEKENSYNKISHLPNSNNKLIFKDIKQNKKKDFSHLSNSNNKLTLKDIKQNKEININANANIQKNKIPTNNNFITNKTLKNNLTSSDINKEKNSFSNLSESKISNGGNNKLKRGKQKSYENYLLFKKKNFSSIQDYDDSFNRNYAKIINENAIKNNYYSEPKKKF